MKKSLIILSLIVTCTLFAGCGNEKGKGNDMFKQEIAQTNNIKVSKIQKKDVTSSYSKYDEYDISKIYSYSYNKEVIAYGFKAEAQGYSTKNKIIYETAYYTSNNKIVALKVISEKETYEIGGILLKNEDFLNQFKELEIINVSQIDNQTGPTAEVTISGVRSSLINVSNFYLTKIKNEKPINASYPNEENAIKGYFDNNVTLVDITSSYNNLVFDQYNEILKIYEVKNNDTLIAYGFVASTAGIGMGLVYATAIEISSNQFKGMYSTNNHEHYAQYTFQNSQFLSQFSNLDIDAVSTNIDIETGVTLTIEGIKNSLIKVANYYKTNLVTE